MDARRIARACASRNIRPWRCGYTFRRKHTAPESFFDMILKAVVGS